MSQPARTELSFRESVDHMFNRAVAMMDLSPGLREKIRATGPTTHPELGKQAQAVSA